MALVDRMCLTLELSWRYASGGVKGAEGCSGVWSEACGELDDGRGIAWYEGLVM